jgi:hypothetical protein
MHLPLLHQLGDQEFGVFALGECPELALELARNHPPLLHCRVFDRRLDNSHRVMLENEVLDTALNNIKQLLDESFPLILLDVRLEPKLLPQLLRALDNIRVRLCVFALLREGFLLCVRFP